MGGIDCSARKKCPKKNSLIFECENPIAKLHFFSTFYITVHIQVLYNAYNVTIQSATMLSSLSTFQTKDEDDERPGSKESVKLNMKAIGKFKHLAQNVDTADAIESSDSIDDSISAKNRYF